MTPPVPTSLIVTRGLYKELAFTADHIAVHDAFLFPDMAYLILPPFRFLRSLAILNLVKFIKKYMNTCLQIDLV